MALFTCIECGKEVSESARKCENCGAYIYASIGTSYKIRIKYNMLVCLLVAFGTAFIFSNAFYIGIPIVIIGGYIGFWVHRFPKRVEQ
jgi:hypothetical protein